MSQALLVCLPGICSLLVARNTCSLLIQIPNPPFPQYNTLQAGKDCKTTATKIEPLH